MVCTLALSNCVTISVFFSTREKIEYRPTRIMSSHAYKIDIVVDIINSLLDSQTKLKDQTKSIFLKRW